MSATQTVQSTIPAPTPDATKHLRRDTWPLRGDTRPVQEALTLVTPVRLLNPDRAPANYRQHDRFLAYCPGGHQALVFPISDNKAITVLKLRRHHFDLSPLSECNRCGAKSHAVVEGTGCPYCSPIIRGMNL